MNKKNNVRFFVLPIFVVILALFNYSQLEGTENIRAIHVVTLITIGLGLGVLLQNVFNYFKRRGGDKETIV